MSKFRKDFVTNSSSSSFVCEISGDTERGWDMCLSEAGMVECENGHTFYEKYLIKDLDDVTNLELVVYAKEKIDSCSDYMKTYYENIIEKLSNKSEEETDEEREEIFEQMEWRGGYAYPDIICPLCQFKVLTKSEICMYIEKETGITRAEVFAVIKEQNRRRRKLYDDEYISYGVDKMGMS